MHSTLVEQAAAWLGSGFGLGCGLDSNPNPNLNPNDPYRAGGARGSAITRRPHGGGAGGRPPWYSEWR